MRKTVYFLGDKYYHASGSMIGVLYTEGGYRYDWGFLQQDVAHGIEVLVKPATPDLIKWADEKLAEIKKERV